MEWKYLDKRNILLFFFLLAIVPFKFVDGGWMHVYVIYMASQAKFK